MEQTSLVLTNGIIERLVRQRAPQDLFGTLERELLDRRRGLRLTRVEGAIARRRGARLAPGSRH